MEKTLTIDGKQVRFKSSGAIPMRYKNQFGKDYFSDLLPLYSTFKNKKNLSEKDLEKIDFEVFFNMAWVLAKTADKTISEPLEWFDSFDEFPIFEILPEIQDMLASSMQSKKK